MFSASAVLLAPLGVAMQTWGALLLLSVYVVVFAWARPYEKPTLNRLERVALASNAATLFLGLGLFNNARSDTSTSVGLSQVLSALIVLCNAAFVTFFLYVLVREQAQCGNKFLRRCQLLLANSVEFVEPRTRGRKSLRQGTKELAKTAAWDANPVAGMHELVVTRRGRGGGRVNGERSVNN